jgi:hypothetical protein
MNKMDAKYTYRLVFSEIYMEFWVQNIPENYKDEVPKIETSGSFTAIAIENLERADFMVNELINKGYKRDYLLDDVVKRN